MKTHRPPALRIAAVAVAAWLAVAAGGAALAQEKGAKLPTPRLTPVPSGSTAIPAGPDTGSPATSDSVPLGTPVVPANAAERDALRSQSAAARAAARGKAPATAASAAADCARGSLTAPVAPVADGQPVALPGSGFTGSTVAPSTRAAISRGTRSSAGCR